MPVSSPFYLFSRGGSLNLPKQIVVKQDASGTKGILSCGKYLFEYMCIAANVAHIQADNIPNV